MLPNREIMAWAKVGHSTNWATQVPLYVYSLKSIIDFQSEMLESDPQNILDCDI